MRVGLLSKIFIFDLKLKEKTVILRISSLNEFPNKYRLHLEFPTKIKEIEESFKLVQKHLPDSFEKFSGLELVKDGIYKRLEFCIENVFDICAIINTDLELGIPESDENIVDNLKKNNIIRGELGENLKSMRGFRNILVHRYGRINDELAFKIMKEHLHDFSRFLKEIKNFIEQE